MDYLYVIILIFNHSSRFVILKKVVKMKEKFEKIGHVKNNDQSKKYILRGQRNVIYYERTLSNKKILIISRLSSV